MATVIRGDDNFDSADYGGLGFDQTWTDLSASRANNTVYTNSTGKPIEALISASAASDAGFVLYINALGSFYIGRGVRNPVVSITIPDGSTYKIILVTGTIADWLELR